MSISHRERLETTLTGEKPDRPPIALWHHFPMDDQDPARQAKATIAFQNQFDLDFIKVMPASSFCIRDWGVEDEWRGHKEGTRAYTHRAIHHPEDWLKLRPLEPHQGQLAQQLACLRILQAEYGSTTPFIQTIFNPLSQAKNLVGPDQLPVHLRRYPDAVHQGLKTIQETILRFIEAAKQTGISGIFYAIQHASHHILTEEEYLAFGKAYDLPILQTVNDLWLNMAHIHGTAIMFNLLADYPLQILNWHDRETAPTLAEGLAKFPGTACGGIGRFETFELGAPKQIQQEARDAFEETGGKRWILGTGCGLPLTTPYGNILAARQSVETLI